MGIPLIVQSIFQTDGFYKVWNGNVGDVYYKHIKYIKLKEIIS